MITGGFFPRIRSSRRTTGFPRISAGPVLRIHGIVERVRVQVQLGTIEEHRVLRRPPPRSRLVVPEPEPHQPRRVIGDAAGEADRQIERRVAGATSSQANGFSLVRSAG